MAEPPAKKPKTSASGAQVFKISYTEEWPCIIKSRLSVHHAFCTICATDFSIGHSGRFDCRTHVNGAKHKKLAATQNKNASISTLFKSMQSDENNSHSTKVLKAEVRIADFIAKSNLSLSVANDFSDMLKDVCPDSAIAKDIHCKRTKATELIGEMAAITQETLVNRMQNGPFTISTDGSNDMGCTKLFPLVVRSVSTKGVFSELLSVPTCEGSATGEKIFSLVDSFFQTNNIPWENCIALGVDNANVMTGSKNGFFGFCRDKNPDIYLSGCLLHLVHIGAEKGSSSLPFNFSDLLVDIFYYFKKSSLRCDTFKMFQDLHGKDQLKMLKHGQTRWLSMGRCLERLLVNWEPLKDFFKAEAGKKTLTAYAKAKVDKVLEALQSRSTRLFCMFLRYAIKPMEHFLTTCQTDSPRIGAILSESRKLIRTLMLKFLCPAAFSGNKSVEDVDYKSAYNFKENSQLLIGEECRSFIDNKEKNGLSSSKVKSFYDHAKAYFQTVVEYLLRSLPIKDPVLNKLSLCDPSQLASSSVNNIRYFANKFPVLLSKDCDIDSITEQFVDLQCQNIQLEKDEKMDAFWIRIAKIKENDSEPFQKLSKFILGLLTIPHSSAHCERVFSMVRKIQTDQRASLAPQTLQNLLIVKNKQDSTFDCAALSLPHVRRLKKAYTKGSSV